MVEALHGRKAHLGSTAGIRLDRVIKLASNENSLGPSPKALQAIQEQRLICTVIPTNALRSAQALGEHLGLAANQFIVTNGGDELIMLISRHTLSQATRSWFLIRHSANMSLALSYVRYGH